MSQSLSKLLSLWSLSTPAFDEATLQLEICDIQERLRQDGICQSIPGSRGWTCTDCDVRCPVEYVPDSQGRLQPYVHCQSCGVYQVDAALLARWKIDTPRFLEVLFCWAKLAVQERGSNHLWQIGRATFAGRSRDVWFVRNYRPSNCKSIMIELRTWPNAILFTSTVDVAKRLQEAQIDNLIISLESIIDVDQGKFRIDFESVDSRVKDRDLFTKPKRAVKPKRADKLVAVDKLKDKLKAHMLSARDHAFDTQRRTGEPALLPRPLQKDLAKLTGLTEAAVSRRLNSNDDPELKIVWNSADSLDDVMNWQTSKKRGRKK